MTRAGGPVTTRHQPGPASVRYVRIAPDDPRRADVRALLEAHLGWVALHSPPEDVHALDVDGLVGPTVLFVSCRDPVGALLGAGALKELGAGHGELKSMHTAATARGRGVGRAVLTYLVDEARDRGLTRVSLETGTPDAFAPARALYASAGFAPCEPFGDYAASPYSAFLTLPL